MKPRAYTSLFGSARAPTGLRTHAPTHVPLRHSACLRHSPGNLATATDSRPDRLGSAISDADCVVVPDTQRGLCATSLRLIPRTLQRSLTMSEKREVPLPISTAPSAKGWRQSRYLWPLLVSLLAYNVLTILPSAVSSASALAGVALERAQDVYDDLRFSDSFDWDSFDAQVNCPEQPKAIYAPIVWNMTKSDRARSADLYSQAVVSYP